MYHQCPCSRTKRLEALLVGGGCVGLAFFTLVHPSIAARSLVVSSECAAIAVLSILVLLRCPDTIVRFPSVATAVLWGVFVLAMAVRCVGALLHRVPRDYFLSSSLNVINLFSFELVIVGVPLGYLWMTATRLWADPERTSWKSMTLPGSPATMTWTAMAP